MKKLAIILIMAATLFATGCKKLPEFTSSNGNSGGGDTPTVVKPEVVTSEATEITENFAMLNGVISNYDGNYTYERGFYWGTTEALDSFISADDFGHGAFGTKFAGLTANTTYYYKAYAIISGGGNENAGYGEVMSFTTLGGNQDYSELIVGRWKTSDGGHYEVYNTDGTGKLWDPADDVQEEEADTFEWTIEGNHMTQIIHLYDGQSVVPQYCNIIELSETTFRYNDDGRRTQYELTRVE